MAPGKFSMDDYIDVAERVQDFKDAHPDGTLQTIDWTIAEVGNQRFIVYRAAAFRSPDDPRPGHGIAWEPFPGKTPYTKDSELMNAETAAWGRAIVALGLTANRKLASRQEVRARVEDQAVAAEKPSRPKKSSKGAAQASEVEADTSQAKPAAPSPDVLVEQIRAATTKYGKTADWLMWALAEVEADVAPINNAQTVDERKAAIGSVIGSLTLEQAILLVESMGGTVEDLA